ncbi:MAG: ABC transporter ATP-binding protein [Actinomycetota bacterium]|nr:ABC transporter ATP-binding protein [Actinomycetota bacterium]
MAVDQHHRPHEASIDPDQLKPWHRRLLPLLRARRGLFSTTLVCGIVGLSIQVSVPMVLRRAIDVALDEQSGGLSNYVWVLLMMATAAFGLRFTYRYLLFKTAYLIETDLRSLIYHHLTRLPFAFYDRTASGEVISRANSDIRSIQLLLAFGPLAILSVLSSVLAFALMLSIHVWFALVAVAGMPLVYVLAQRMRDHVFPLSWVTQGRMAEVAMVVDENISGTRIVKSFAAETDQIAALSRAADRLRWSATALIDARARFNPAIEALPRLGMAVVLLYGGWLAIDGQVGVGTLLAFSSWVIMISVPFRMLGFVLLQAQRAAASSIRIFEILDEDPLIVDSPGARPLVDPSGRVEFRGVHFAYPGGENPAVLDAFSLTVEAGETVALVGRTGCGKSTIARLIPRFYDVDAGAVLIDGVDVRDVTIGSLRQCVSQVPDEPFLFSESIRANVAFSRPDAPLTDVAAATSAAAAAAFISELDDQYEEVVGERGYTLSGGQRQRIAIARTLLANPRILILDDATSAIDVEVEATIHSALRELLADRTTIVIAHRLSTISLADRVVLIENGCVAAEGTHQHLLATDRRYESILASGKDRVGL